MQCSKLTFSDMRWALQGWGGMTNAITEMKLTAEERLAPMQGAATNIVCLHPILMRNAL